MKCLVNNIEKVIRVWKRLADELCARLEQPFLLVDV